MQLLSISSNSRRATAFKMAGLVAAVLIVYWTSLEAPFVFDDIPAVERNPSIRHVWAPWEVLAPKTDGSGVAGRPLVNLSLAINFAWGGLNVRGYHLMNMVLHAAVALLLWGILRKTLPLISERSHQVHAPGARQKKPASNGETELFAWSAALLWAVHPLLSESVVCVVQRNEIIGSLFYLLTFYCFLRSVPVNVGAPARPVLKQQKSENRWAVCSVLSCLAGVAGKEIIGTAPLVVFLYDRTFVAGSFREAWKFRRKYYLMLATTWVALAWQVGSSHQRGGTVGFGLGITPWQYLLTQCQALVLYLKLSFWPQPLVLDYGWPVARGLSEVWWQALLIVGLLAATLIALVRKPVMGFVGASFFLILAPSSSFVPLTTQTIAEHRMYLPLVAVVVSTIAGCYVLVGRKALWTSVAAAAFLGGMTVHRIRDYRSELAIWTETVAARPLNARAHGNLGRAYLSLGRWVEALTECRKEMELDPNYRGDARINIGHALTELGRPSEALDFFEQGLKLKPCDFDVYNNYGVALAAVGRWNDAIAQYQTALAMKPDFSDACNNLANALTKVGRQSEAWELYEKALHLKPEFIEAEVNWARSLAEAGRLPEALMHFEKVARARPVDADAQEELAKALAMNSRPAEAVEYYQSALRLQPHRASSQCGLGNALASLGRIPEAIAHYEAALGVDPANVEAQHNLAVALMRLDRPSEALPHFAATVRLLPGSADAHHELALALGELSRWGEAAQHEEEALRLRDNFTEARDYLTWLRQRQ